MKKSLLLIGLLLALFIHRIMAQDRTVSGKVISTDNGEVLPGVSVTVKGTTTGITTGADGTYRLNIADNTTLVFSFIGFVTQETPVGNRSVIDVQLKPDVKNLSEVVVVGYGTQQKKDLTGSVTQVSSKDIQNVPVQSFEQAIQGRATGVQVENTSGKAGGAIKIRVRGSASVSAGNQPLYVVDGFPITKESQSDPLNEESNPLIDINPNDIESIEVLKDASAAAIYGSRASNGVVLITTKRGKSGKTNFSINLSGGTSEPARLAEFLDRDQYIQMMTDAAANIGSDIATEYSGNTPEDWNSAVAANTNTNWQKAAYHTANFRQFDVSASGGNEKTKFYLGGGYSSQEGIVLNNQFERISGRLNIDHQATRKLGFGGSFNLARTVNNRVNENNSFTSVTQANALAPITPFIDPATGDYNNNTFYDNPFLQNAHQTNVTTGYRTFSNVYGTYAFVPGLVFRTEFGIDLLDQIEDFYAGRTTPDGRPSGFGTYRTARVFNYTTNNTLTFNQTFSEDHQLEALIGTSYQQSDANTSTINGQGFPSDDFRTLVSASKITFGSSSNTSFSYLS